MNFGRILSEYKNVFKLRPALIIALSGLALLFYYQYVDSLQTIFADAKILIALASAVLIFFFQMALVQYYGVTVSEKQIYYYLFGTLALDIFMKSQQEKLKLMLAASSISSSVLFLAVIGLAVSILPLLLVFRGLGLWNAIKLVVFSNIFSFILFYLVALVMHLPLPKISFAEATGIGGGF